MSNTLNIPSDVVTVLESTIETNKTVVSNIINKELSVVSKLHLERYLSFIDDPDVKLVVTVLTNDFDGVQDIVNTLHLILSDGKVDMSDAPLLLGLIKKIVSLRTKDLNLSKTLTLNHFLDIIKVVFTVLAKESILKIDNIDEFITEINKIIKVLKDGDAVVNAMGCCLSFYKKN